VHFIFKEKKFINYIIVMITSEKKFILEAMFCLQKMNEKEEGHYNNELCSSFFEDINNEVSIDTKMHDSVEIKDAAFSNEHDLLAMTKTLVDDHDAKTNETKVERKYTKDSTESKETTISSASNKDKLGNLNYDFIECSYNYKNNYENYVTKSLKSMLKFKNFSFDQEVQKRTFSLPQSSKSKILLIDLDETLIHSDFDSSDKNCSFFDYELSESVGFKVILRPGVHEFLKTLSSHFHIGLFTASIKEYADSVMNLLDPTGELFSFKCYRDSCIKVGRAYVKDLRIFGKDLKDIVLLDNSIYSFANNLSNGILIDSFYKDEKDNELQSMLGYLIDYIAKCDDVTFVNEQVFAFQKIFNSMLVDKKVNTFHDC